MKRKFILFYVLCFVFFHYSHEALAQDTQRESLDSLFDQMHKEHMQMRKKMLEMMKGGDPFFSDEDFLGDSFFNRPGPTSKMRWERMGKILSQGKEVEYSMKEEGTEVILTLIMTLDEKNPLDISINQDQIVIKRPLNFQIATPEGVDYKKAKIESEKGKVFVKFPKLVSHKNKEELKPKPSSGPGLKPVRPSTGDQQL